MHTCLINIKSIRNPQFVIRNLFNSDSILESELKSSPRHEIPSPCAESVYIDIVRIEQILHIHENPEFIAEFIFRIYISHLVWIQWNWGFLEPGLISFAGKTDIGADEKLFGELVTRTQIQRMGRPAELVIISGVPIRNKTETSGIIPVFVGIHFPVEIGIIG